MTDTPETDGAERESIAAYIEEYGPDAVFPCDGYDHARKLERERNGLHDLHNKNATRSAELLELCQTLRKERDMYERQVTCLLERLGKTQERMIDAERGKQNSNKREFTLPYINTNQND